MSEAELHDFGPVIGHADARDTLQEALRLGRMHHAWIFSGPRGVGKSRLAKLFAASLMSGSSMDDFDYDSHIADLVRSGAHPDLRVYERPVDEKGRMKTEIPVDSIRDLVHFFTLRPAMGGWRIAIVDAADELNRNSANALLKTLEEPPKNSLLILIHHGEAPLLPTLKSRCRRLVLHELSDEETARALTVSGLSKDTAVAVSAYAQGSPGRAQELQGKDAQSAHKAALSLGAANRPINAKVLSEAFGAGAKSDVAFYSIFDGLMTSAAKAARQADTPLESGEWSSLYSRLADLYSEAKGLNMDKSQAIAAAVLDVQRTRQSL